MQCLIAPPLTLVPVYQSFASSAITSVIDHKLDFGDIEARWRARLARTPSSGSFSHGQPQIGINNAQLDCTLRTCDPGTNGCAPSYLTQNDLPSNTTKKKDPGSKDIPRNKDAPHMNETIFFF